MTFMVQMQLANLAQEMKEVHRVVSRIQQGLEFDRLASAYSNERKLKYARQIQNKELQTQDIIDDCSFCRRFSKPFDVRNEREY